jgi:hypothetical protein
MDALHNVLEVNAVQAELHRVFGPEQVRQQAIERERHASLMSRVFAVCASIATAATSVHYIQSYATTVVFRVKSACATAHIHNNWKPT